ncbi:VOC family protein [Erythrobacter alti]|uniref:VOC family protein n=1 Tax=Erythrobacter alti TaxID=1896145 RepID=UPI0030F3B00A
MTQLSPFHLAFPVDSLIAARAFWGEVMGCKEGRSSDDWCDFDFYGHQIVAHQAPSIVAKGGRGTNPVDGHDVPVPHFGIVLDMDQWRELAERLIEKGVEFEIAPYIRFEGEPGEQATMFFRDPAGNAIEMKAIADRSKLFARD